MPPFPSTSRLRKAQCESARPAPTLSGKLTNVLFILLAFIPDSFEYQTRKLFFLIHCHEIIGAKKPVCISRSQNMCPYRFWMKVPRRSEINHRHSSIVNPSAGGTARIWRVASAYHSPPIRRTARRSSPCYFPDRPEVGPCLGGEALELLATSHFSLLTSHFSLLTSHFSLLTDH